MNLERIIERTQQPATVASLCEQLQAIGIQSGHTVLVHGSFSKLGYVSGGPAAVIMALLTVVGQTGTLMMPTHTADNTDPANWGHPPVPEPWWQTIRATAPAFDPLRTPSRAMGILAELFRTWPGVSRSEHPVGSFAAIGPQASYLLANHVSLEAMFGESSPVSKLYDLDGHVLLLGVTHENNTSLHLAEYRANYPTKRQIPEGTAMLEAGTRQWKSFNMLAINNDDFNRIGADYELIPPTSNDSRSGFIGLADATYLRQRPLVDFAVRWMESHRA